MPLSAKAQKGKEGRRGLVSDRRGLVTVVDQQGVLMDYNIGPL